MVTQEQEILMEIKTVEEEIDHIKRHGTYDTEYDAMNYTRRIKTLKLRRRDLMKELRQVHKYRRR